MYNSPLPIRGHHLLCILGFRGYGYSEGFTENMQEVVRIIRSNFEAILEVLDGCDVICAPCPYNTDGVCRKNAGSPEGVKEFDRKVLKILGISPSSKISARQVYSLVEEKITPADMLKMGCKDCEWWGQETCVEGLRFIRDFCRT